MKTNLSVLTLQFRSLLLSLAILLTGTAAHAQWVGTNPGPIYYNGGKVGIGTAPPQWDLDVSGSIGVLGTNSFVRTSTNADTQQLTFLGTRLRLGQINSRAYGYAGSAIAYIGGFSDGELLRLDSNNGAGNLVVTQAGVGSLLAQFTNTNLKQVHTDTASAINMFEFAEGATTYGFLNQRGSTHAEPGKFNIGNNVGALGIYAAGVQRINVTTGGQINVLGNLSVSGSITGATVVNATYQDLAEWVPSMTDMQPGTVVVLDASKVNYVRASSGEYDPSVAGVVSAQPGVLLGVGSAEKEMIATTGRVKVRVDATAAPIAIGDLLVTSARPGVAMRSMPVEIQGRKFHQPGTILGKALEPLPSGEGEILVLLSLQ